MPLSRQAVERSRRFNMYGNTPSLRKDGQFRIPSVCSRQYEAAQRASAGPQCFSDGMETVQNLIVSIDWCHRAGPQW
jgi:hypothetical protein